MKNEINEVSQELKNYIEKNILGSSTCSKIFKSFPVTQLPALYPIYKKSSLAIFSCNNINRN